MYVIGFLRTILCRGTQLYCCMYDSPWCTKFISCLSFREQKEQIGVSASKTKRKQSDNNCTVNNETKYLIHCTNGAGKINIIWQDASLPYNDFWLQVPFAVFCSFVEINLYVGHGYISDGHQTRIRPYWWQCIYSIEKATYLDMNLEVLNRTLPSKEKNRMVASIVAIDIKKHHLWNRCLYKRASQVIEIQQHRQNYTTQSKGTNHYSIHTTCNKYHRRMIITALWWFKVQQIWFLWI